MMQPGAFEATLKQIVREVVRDELRAAFAQLHAAPRNAANSERFLSIAKAAAFADVAPGTLRRWIRTGRLSAVRAGRVHRIAQHELVDFLAREGRSVAVVERARTIAARAP